MNKFKIIFFIFLIVYFKNLYSKEVEYKEEDKDYLNYFNNNRSYLLLKNKGIKIVNLKEEESFFVFWIPPKYSSQRIMVALHGTGGTAYDEVKDELEMAEKYDYMIIGIQWFNRGKKLYYPALKVNRIIDKALQYIGEKYNNSLEKIAFIGFSRGSAISYELAYIDKQFKKYFDLIIAHSGGIPFDFVIAPGENPNPDKFLLDLTKGNLGKEPFKGINFILYAGKKDEQWGERMYQYMENTKIIINKYGGNVIEMILDEHGTHLGYRLNKENHEKGIKYFIDLTK